MAGGLLLGGGHALRVLVHHKRRRSLLEAGGIRPAAKVTTQSVAKAKGDMHISLTAKALVHP